MGVEDRGGFPGLGFDGAGLQAVPVGDPSASEAGAGQQSIGERIQSSPWTVGSIRVLATGELPPDVAQYVDGEIAPTPREYAHAERAFNFPRQVHDSETLYGGRLGTYINDWFEAARAVAGSDAAGLERLLQSNYRDHSPEGKSRLYRAGYMVGLGLQALERLTPDDVTRHSEEPGFAEWFEEMSQVAKARNADRGYRRGPRYTSEY